MSSRARRQLAIERTRELQNTVEHWDKDVGQNCNEFIRGNKAYFNLKYKFLIIICHNKNPYKFIYAL